MDLLARKFARKVLLAHLALLLAIALLVLAAARQLHTATRNQVIAQTTKRQELLAWQAARGIEDFYQGIFDNLHQIRRSSTDDPSTSPAAPTTQSDRLRSGRPMRMPRGPELANLLWWQLSDRVSQLISFTVDPNAPARPAAVDRVMDRTTDRLGERREIAVDRRTRPADGNRPEPIALPNVLLYGQVPGNTIPADAVADAARHQLKRHGDARPFVTGVIELGPEKKPVTLVVVPPTDHMPRAMAAVVPVEKIEERFGKAGREQIAAVLVDDTRHTVATSEPAFAGATLPNVGRLKARVAAASTNTAETVSHTDVVTRHVEVNGVRLPPAVVTWEPVDLEGSRWTLSVSTPLADVDTIVDPVFRKAFAWAVFVIGAFAGVLTSTAVFMIRNRVRLERQRMEVITKSLSEARAIQLAWLPGAEKICDGLEIAATNQPAQHISGDFYNWFDAGDCRTVVLIGDVTGHGMSAAFLMATTQLLVRNTFARTGDPGKCLEEVNRQLCVQAFNGQFVTMLLMIIDTKAGRARLAVAGHPPPLLSRDDGFHPVSVEPQLVLGVDRDATYVTEEIELAHGSALVLYTDGVQDATGPAGDRFGTDGLQRSLAPRPATARAAMDAILRAVNNHRQTAPLGDDLTLVTVRLTEPATVPVTAG